MVVGDLLYGMVELYCIVVDDDRCFGKVVFVRYKSVLINNLLDFFFMF